MLGIGIRRTVLILILGESLQICGSRGGQTGEIGRPLETFLGHVESARSKLKCCLPAYDRFVEYHVVRKSGCFRLLLILQPELRSHFIMIWRLVKLSELKKTDVVDVFISNMSPERLLRCCVSPAGNFAAYWLRYRPPCPNLTRHGILGS